MAITDIEDQISAIINRADPDQFIYDFLSVYDFPRATITKLRKGTNNLANEPGEVYLKNRLFFKRVAPGTNLMQAFSDLQQKVAQLGAKPRYLLATDFQEVLAEDTKTGTTLAVEFARLPQKFEFFLAWNGIEKADFDKENPADIRAAERFAKLYDVVIKDNPDASRHGLNLFLIRVLFCLFAEDTAIFQKNLFTDRVKQLTKPNGSDLDHFFQTLFGVLDFPLTDRPADTPSWLADFPYVDGDLFQDPHEPLAFSPHARQLIIDAGEKLEWDQINPDILGSMLQAVASEDKRSHLGMHYTSVPNIMKVIKPLFLDDLRQAFEAARGNRQKLEALYDRIGQIKFMDPACGSGNFLIITYKELRQLEIEILRELNNMGLATMYVPSVTLDQFFGIEIEDFACDVTRLSLWIAEHQMNVQLHREIADAVRPTLPLQHAGAIINANALRTDWNAVLPHQPEDEVYLFGNPPYLGSKLQNGTQKQDLKLALGENLRYKKLDYISGWFMKGANFIANSRGQVSFVTTNSITQGEQVSLLWPALLQKVQIKFAYQSFVWQNNAKNNAGVMVAIIGLNARNAKLKGKKAIFAGATKENVATISPYLTDSEDVIVAPQKQNINHFPKMVMGSMPRDGGYLILSPGEKDQFLAQGVDPQIIRPYVGASEFVKGTHRYCLWMDQTTYEENRAIPAVQERVNQVQAYRKMSKAASTRNAATTPWSFVQRGEYDRAYGNNYAGKHSIIIPKVTSGNRTYVPIGILPASTILFDQAMAVYTAPIFLLGILQSRMHMTWLRAVGGRLKTDYRYSAGLVYNTFPVPELSTRRKNELETLAWKILDIRNQEGGTLAELYGAPLAGKNPKPMNPRLKAAHEELDRVVERAYRDRPFKDDNERLALLLAMYSRRIKDER